MGLFDRFPWVNTHELNLDWIIQKMKEWGADAAANVAKAETAATNAATAAEPYAVRAEEASARATARAADCLEYTGECKVYSESAATEAAGAGSAAKSARSFARQAEASATDSNNANASAQLAASAAAKSAEEAKTATKWPYDGVYNGYLYKRLGSADHYTTTNMEFLTAPQENGELYRVSGRIPKRGSFNDATDKDYHYEKIIKMTGNVGSTQITFSGSFTQSTYGLTIAEAEAVGLVLFNTSNQSFYKYSSLPLINIDSAGKIVIDSRGFEIPDDYTANISVSLVNEDLTPATATAYLYVRMKYTS